MAGFSSLDSGTGANSGASPAPYPEAGREQQDAVRRRALPIAIAGVICGLGGLGLLLMKRIDEAHPPAVLAVNLSFCAMMMGVGILFYARRDEGDEECGGGERVGDCDWVCGAAGVCDADAGV